MNTPLWLQAGFWGLVAGGSLLLGATIGYMVKVPQRLIALIMAFGAGVLVSALAFELMEEAYNEGGFVSASVGFLLGAVVYTTATGILAHRHEGTRRRKRSGNRQPNETDRPGSGMALAVGALVDGVPESIAIGVSLIGGGKVALATVIAVFLSNIPEGLSSSAGMREAGRSKRYVFGLWGGIALISGVSAILGYAVFSRFDRDLIAGTIAVAAGGILAMLSSTMIPEAFEEGHEYVGIVSCLGFLCAFLLTKMG